MTYEDAVKNLRWVFTEFPKLRLVEKISSAADEKPGITLRIETKSPTE